MYKPALSENTTKQHIRDIIKQRVKALDNKHGKILTLPCLDFTLELELSKTHNVYTVEREEAYYLQQLEITKDIKAIKPQHYSLLEYLLSKPTYQYDYAYLDFCGDISKEIIASLAYIQCTNIAITLMMKREKKRWTQFANTNRQIMHNNLFNSLGYRIKTSIKYNNNSTPMCTYFLTR